MEKQHNILFVNDETSDISADKSLWANYFKEASIAPDTNKALKLIYTNDYDVVIHDITTDPLEGIVFIKQIKQMKPELPQIALVLATDEEKIGGLIDSGVHTFLLMPEQLEQALEAIADMNFQVKKS